MQVALATLWSCFPVSASGADMLLFSLLHTSSGSCCSAETNHGLLRSSRTPLFFLSLSLSFCFFESSLSLFLPIFFSGFLHLRVSFSHSLCFPLFTPKQPSLSMDIQETQRKGRGQDLSAAALPGGNKRDGDLFLSSTPPPHLLHLSVLLILIPWKRCSRLLPRWTFTCSTCLIVCVWLWCSGKFFLSCTHWQQTLSVAYRW